MVGARQCQDELAWPLKGLVDLDFLLLKVGWRDHCDNIKQNVGVFLE